MPDAVYEILDYWKQELFNNRTQLKTATEQARQNAICTATNQGHYWIVSPPPTQDHLCRDCGAYKAHVPTPF